MKTLIILLLVSVVALGQDKMDSIGTIKSSRFNGKGFTSAYITHTYDMRDLSQNKEGEIRTLEAPKKSVTKVVIVTADGTLKMIESVKVVTTEIMTEVYKDPNTHTKIGPGMYASTLLGGGYSYQWKDHAHHYEDREGNILTEVYQLTKL